MAPIAAPAHSFAAREIAKTAHSTMLNAVAAFSDAKLPLNDEIARTKILLDYSALYLHWLDRVAFLDLGSNWRPFMSQVSQSLAALLQKAIGPNVPEAERAAATQWMSDLLSVLTGRMADFSVVAEMRQGTVIYEIGASVAESAGRPGDSVVIGIASNAAAIGLTLLRVERLIAAAK